MKSYSFETCSKYEYNCSWFKAWSVRTMFLLKTMHPFSSVQMHKHTGSNLPHALCYNREMKFVGLYGNASDLHL